MRKSQLFLAMMFASVLVLSACGGSGGSAPLPPGATVTVTSSSLIEGNVGATNLVFTVDSNITSGQTITINFSTQDGTAQAGSDYVATSGVITFPAGATGGSIAVPILGDTAIEPDETFTLLLSSPSNASFAGASIVGTIVNDDFPPIALPDILAPVIVLTGANPLTMTQGTIFTDPGSTVIDNVDTGLIAVVTGTVNTAVAATYTLNYDVSDAAGNPAATVSRTVKVLPSTGADQTAPTIFLIGANPVTIAQGSSFIDAGSMVMDNVNTGLIATVTGAVNTAVVGTYTLTYNVSDAAGNAATPVTRTVHVTDQTAPVIALIGANPITVAQGSIYIDAGSSVTDNVDTGLTASVTGTVNTGTVGTYSLTYNVSDAAGNAATPVTRTVNVAADTIAPVITLIGANPITVAQGSTFTDPGSTVTDNLDVGLTATVTGTVDTAISGTYTLTYNVSDAAGNAAITVTRTVNVAVFQPISIAVARVLEGDTGTSNLVFTVSLAAVSTVDISVDYATTSGSAFDVSDFTATTATLTIPANTASGTVTVSVIGDTRYEPNETLTLTLSNPVNVTIATATATGTILNDDIGGINDTGITQWGNASVNNLTVTQNDGQDADHGRDAQVGLVKTGAGRAGFDFSKLNSAGVPVPNTRAQWDCVRDNVTGLTWEVKTTTAGLRKNTNTYTWYNTDPLTNDGNVGTANGGTCTGSSCDTQSYVTAINALTFPNQACGFTDWRLPNIEELRSILEYSIPFPGPAVDTTYFPNTGSYYWSATPYLANASQAWGVSFSGSQGLVDLKNQVHPVRLVRGGQ